MNNRLKSGRVIATLSLSTALIAVGAFIKIPLPMDMYITMQVFFVILSGFLVGRLSSVAALAYMCIGLIGLPVFAAGGGFSYIFKPSFGYILAFIPAGYLTGLLTKKQNCSFLRYFLSGIAGVIVIYIIGIIYLILIVTLYSGNTVTSKYIFITLFLSTIWKDILVTLLAAYVAKKIRRLVRP
ncbi:MAG: biotin transporter BioY [Clostridia bacterium]